MPHSVNCIGQAGRSCCRLNSRLQYLERLGKLVRLSSSTDRSLRSETEATRQPELDLTGISPFGERYDTVGFRQWNTSLGGHARGLAFLQSALFFFSLRDKRRWLDLSALGVFVLYCIGALLFAESIEFKVYVTLLMSSIFILRVLVTRKRRSISQKSSEQ